MAPYIADMTAEEPLGPWVSSPLGEVKLMPERGLKKELNGCKQEVTHCHTDTPIDECAPITDSLCSEEPFCRICHEGRASGELLSPCNCSGSLAMVHRACLEHWLTASNSSHCELCHHQFALERLPKPLTEWLCSPSMQQQRRTLCGDTVCFLFITPLASLSGWLCVQGAMDLHYTNRMEALGLLVLTLALFTIYVFWTVSLVALRTAYMDVMASVSRRKRLTDGKVSVRYHMHLYKTWKKTDQKVRLQIPMPAHTTHNQHTLTINTPGKATSKETMV